jgi:hypothetical protein
MSDVDFPSDILSLSFQAGQSRLAPLELCGFCFSSDVQPERKMGATWYGNAGNDIVNSIFCFIR